MSSRPPHVLLYSHNGVGVGHFRRQLRLATELRRRRPDAAILLVSGSHAASALSGPLGFDVISLPSIRMVDRYETWEPRQPGVTIREVVRMRSDLLRRTVRRFRPDVFVADFMPAGPYGELLDALEELRAGGGRAVAGFRDIIDEPGFVRDLWSRTGVYETLRDHYEAICVYGSREVTDFDAELGLGDQLAERVTYTGYLAGMVQPRLGARRKAPEILACTGGGVDGGKLLETFILAMRARKAADGGVGSTVVVGGPLLEERELSRLRSLAGESSINVSRFILDLDQRIADDDLVVTMPGYNTTCELLSGNARAIVVPRDGPSQEQRMRASWLARWARADVIDPLELTPELLGARIDEVMLKPPPPVPPVPRNGLAQMGALLEAMATGQHVPVTL
jgi:predicted glycosyltransferase